MSPSVSRGPRGATDCGDVLLCCSAAALLSQQSSTAEQQAVLCCVLTVTKKTNKIKNMDSGIQFYLLIKFISIIYYCSISWISSSLDLTVQTSIVLSPFTGEKVQ